jgi:hypothetical protein
MLSKQRRGEGERIPHHHGVVGSSRLLEARRCDTKCGGLVALLWALKAEPLLPDSRLSPVDVKEEALITSTCSARMREDQSG